ncbi:MAG TPA: aminotransferase [Rhodobacteraceae bacterium]|jgi:fructoselysine-6-P-deglycase FrlB-like protein|nr:SIS domain-containing protein [Paracoccaceae bacterium]HBG97477.1 aminotransferase [Paracoccaceae bacterium]
MSPGIEAMRREMARQHADARATLADAADMAGRVAAAIRARGRLVLIGMGGSHWINRAAAPFYAAAGVDATAHVASEYIRAPLPGDPVMLLTSQSGGSGEILRLLDLRLAPAASFGLTVDPDSPLAARLPVLLGAGGPEQAYAATRSQLVTLALHAAILAALGADIAPVGAALDAPVIPDPAARDAAVARLAAVRSVVMVARGRDQGIMDAAALCLMETARLPVLGLEAGQYRHGPFEMVGPDTAVVMLRGAGPAADDLAGLAAEGLRYGIAPVMLDASGRTPVEGALTLRLPPLSGLALGFVALPVLQDIVVAAAARLQPDAGIPQRSTKVTSGEAA